MVILVCFDYKAPATVGVFLCLEVALDCAPWELEGVKVNLHTQYVQIDIYLILTWLPGSGQVCRLTL